MLGIGTPETLRTWIRRGEVHVGLRPEGGSEIAAENKQPRKEIAEDKDHQALAPMVGSGFLGCRDNVRRTV